MIESIGVGRIPNRRPNSVNDGFDIGGIRKHPVNGPKLELRFTLNGGKTSTKTNNVSGVATSLQGKSRHKKEINQNDGCVMGVILQL